MTEINKMSGWCYCMDPKGMNNTLLNNLSDFLWYQCDKFVKKDYFQSSDVVVVYQEDAAIKGMALLFLIGHNEYNLQALCVHRSYRNMGIGSQILNHCLEHVPESSVVTLHVDKFPSLHVDNLKRFYERFGFNVKGENEKEIEYVYMKTNTKT